MKLLFALVFSLATFTAFALPVPPHEAIRGVQSTAAFRLAEQNALTQMRYRYYSKLSIVRVGRDDANMMQLCYPSGLISKSASSVKVTFADATTSKTVYFTTPEKVEDFVACLSEPI